MQQHRQYFKVEAAKQIIIKVHKVLNARRKDVLDVRFFLT
jgi:hypothetical protein